jgi:hypothetical protein
LPTTLTSYLTTCSNPTSAIHQPLTTGMLELQLASTTLMLTLALKPNASGPLLKHLCHKMPASAYQPWLPEMHMLIVTACRAETNLAVIMNAHGMILVPTAQLDQRFHLTRPDYTPSNSVTQIQVQ